MRRSTSATNWNKHTARRWSLSRRLWHDDDLPAYLTEALWHGKADELLNASAALQVKDRCIVVRHDTPNFPLLIKRHTWGNFWRTVRLSWHKSAARYCAEIASFLTQQGIPTPRPRAILEDCIGPLGYRSFLITDFVEGTDLYRFIRYASTTEAELQHIARQVARIWQQLVELGISHNDTKPENFIVDNRLDVWLIDFEKLRLRGKPDRQRDRQVADVKNFLHIRGWHRRAAARQIFLREFMRIPFEGRLAGVIPQPSLETDASLSVIVLGDDSLIADVSVDSVRDVADEILLVAPAGNGGMDILRRVEPCGPNSAPPEWILVLHSDEALTPFAAKELQQHIADPRSADAFRLPIDDQSSPRRRHRSASDAKPVRLFRRDRCSYSLVNGRLVITADPERTGELRGTLEKRGAARDQALSAAEARRAPALRSRAA